MIAQNEKKYNIFKKQNNAEIIVKGLQLIPDNFWVQDYIRKFIIFKCFAKLSNVITDETFNQIMIKKKEADNDQAIAFINAESELKKQTIFTKMKAIKRSYESFDKYKITGDQSYNAKSRN